MRTKDKSQLTPNDFPSKMIAFGIQLPALHTYRLRNTLTVRCKDKRTDTQTKTHTTPKWGIRKTGKEMLAGIFVKTLSEYLFLFR